MIKNLLLLFKTKSEYERAIEWVQAHKDHINPIRMRNELGFIEAVAGGGEWEDGIRAGLDKHFPIASEVRAND